MIDLTEKQIEEIREHTQHRRVLREKLNILQANEETFNHVHVRFEGKEGTVEMKQGDRGGLLGDMLCALVSHLKEQIGVLNDKLSDLGVRVS